ncbi:hypothetical protein NDU88_006125 [Pleurodeles waltl]|uniref:Uncharacterized protein n=1 Tax=Pleurodeles waltl TaxID=8319 RepID=A0AAV7N7S7_PLEWA|nr:hypothetical protein NDU88_006125 [Pleurodeles waltl]
MQWPGNRSLPQTRTCVDSCGGDLARVSPSIFFLSHLRLTTVSAKPSRGSQGQLDLEESSTRLSVQIAATQDTIHLRVCLRRRDTRSSSGHVIAGKQQSQLMPCAAWLGRVVLELDFVLLDGTTGKQTERRKWCWAGGHREIAELKAPQRRSPEEWEDCPWVFSLQSE